MTRARVLTGSGLVAGALAFALHRSQPAAFDFVALYASARLVATGNGSAVTDPAALAAAEHAAAPERVAYLNSPNLPVVSLILSPLARLPYETAYLVVLVCGVVALGAAAALLAARAPGGRAGVAALTLLAPPSIIALAQGQTTPFVLVALLAAERTGPIAAGVLLASAVIRPQLLPLMAVVAWGDRRRALAFGAGVATAVAASFAVAGADAMARYPELLRLAASETGNDEIGLGPSLVAVGAIPLAIDPVAANVAVSAVVLIVGAVAVSRAGRSERLPLAGTWSQLGSPHGLFHDLLFAYPEVRAVGGKAGLAFALAGSAALLAQLIGLRAVPVWLGALIVARGARRAAPVPSADGS
jgi:glycosyl transferase family 87